MCLNQTMGVQVPLLHDLGTWHMLLPKPGIAILANIVLGELLFILQNPIQLSLNRSLLDSSQLHYRFKIKGLLQGHHALLMPQLIVMSL